MFELAAGELVVDSRDPKCRDGLKSRERLGIHQRGVQSEGGAVDGGSIV